MPTTECAAVVIAFVVVPSLGIYLVERVITDVNRNRRRIQWTAEERRQIVYVMREKQEATLHECDVILRSQREGKLLLGTTRHCGDRWQSRRRVCASPATTTITGPDSPLYMSAYKEGERKEVTVGKGEIHFR
jgi:hypothetical protein